MKRKRNHEKKRLKTTNEADYNKDFYKKKQIFETCNFYNFAEEIRIFCLAFHAFKFLLLIIWVNFMLI